MIEINKTRIYKKGGDLLTKNPYTKKYEKIDPRHSKLAAAVKKGLSQTGIKENSRVLYLGASHGYTPGHVSNIVGKGGLVFCVENSVVVARDLVLLCKEKSNMHPLIFSADKPGDYKDRLVGVDVVYQDVAQKNQVGIFLKNLGLVKKGGFGLLALKARSYDVSKKPGVVFKEVLKELEKETNVVDFKLLDPYEKDHAFYVVKKK